MKTRSLPYIWTIVPPNATVCNTSATVNSYVDTLGYKMIRYVIVIGPTNIAMTAAPYIQECTASGGTYANITGATITTAPASTADNTCYVIDVAVTGKRARYQKPVLACGDGSTFISAIALGYFKENDTMTADGTVCVEHVAV